MLKCEKDDGRDVANCDFTVVYEVSSAVGF